MQVALEERTGAPATRRPLLRCKRRFGEKNTRFAESLGIGYPILSDPTKEVARAYGVLGLTGLASRWTFYIGSDGIIRDIDRTVSASTHGPTVVERARALTHTS